jgi:hypothetical protein
MRIIDCSACIGFGTVNRVITNHEKYPVYEKVRQIRDACELLEEMDFCGVSESYIYHQIMIDVGPCYGNQLAVQEAAASPNRLHATWTILPPITGEIDQPEAFILRMKDSNVCALRAYPQQNRYFLDRVTMGELLDVMCERNIPLYLSPSEQWEYIYSALREFPKLTVILTNYGLWGSERFIFPLVRAYENFYVDTSDYQLLAGIENFVRKFGSERLLFGSNLPMDTIGGPLTTLLGSGIAKDDIENILHKNMERLIGRVVL